MTTILLGITITALIALVCAVMAGTMARLAEAGMDRSARKLARPVCIADRTTCPTGWYAPDAVARAEPDRGEPMTRAEANDWVDQDARDWEIRLLADNVIANQDAPIEVEIGSVFAPKEAR
jgi:hypothetical protein